MKGCPKKAYYSDEMYNNLDCLSINKASRCFTSDPSCPVPESEYSGTTGTTTSSSSISTYSTKNTVSSDETYNHYPTSGIVGWIVAIILIFAIIAAATYKFRRKILQRCPCKQPQNNTEDLEAKDKMMPAPEISEEQQRGTQPYVAHTDSLDEGSPCVVAAEDLEAKDKMMPAPEISEEQQRGTQPYVAHTDSLDQGSPCLDADDEHSDNESVVSEQPNREDSVTKASPSSTPDNQMIKSTALRGDTPCLIQFGNVGSFRSSAGTETPLSSPHEDGPRNNEEDIVFFTPEQQIVKSSTLGRDISGIFQLRNIGTFESSIRQAPMDISLDNEILMIVSPRKNGNTSFSSTGTPFPLVRICSAKDLYKPQGDFHEEKRMVAAIDFGTSYSGYSYSLYRDFKDNPNLIQIKQWNVNRASKPSPKTPTTLLLDSDLEVKAFGYEAEEQYMDLAENDTHHDYYLFERFKMMLKEKEKELGSPSTVLLDKTGKKLEALKIVAKAIKHLKSALILDFRQHTNQHKDLQMCIHNIHWVLTVPTMWGKTQNEFMCEAAKMAGISRQNLILTDEATAVAYFCKYLPLDRMQGSSNVSYLKPGTKYMVLDAGGGTVDITVHEIKFDFNLKKLGKLGGPFGGTRVDQSFMAVLEEILGKDFLIYFSKKHTADYLDFLQQFEYKKRRVEVSFSKIFSLRPRMTFSDEYENKFGTSIGEAVKISQYNKLLIWNGDKLTIDKTLVAELFKTSFEGIVSMVKKLLAKPNVKGTQIIIMVGGFSESPYLQNKIRTEFQSPLYHVLIPDEPSLAILKGAVIYGHQDSNYHLRQMCGGYSSS
ncbi:heat shock 70 kDa protein 12A-like [Saccostrea cucullata]|uniref:heat shock 70 kDa protein 12A-like n=1 Tax=Saccostrea cuccullata TaxID=36930 RepID=UPI002ED6B4C2